MSELRSETVIGALVRDRRQVARDLVELAKPRVVLMVALTTLVGYHAGVQGGAEWARVVHLLVGTLLAAGGALALNQHLERAVDARMERTRARPLPEGRLQPLEALLFGWALTLTGTLWLLAFVGWLSASVTAATAVLYLYAYTPLKVRSALATVVGAVPGALPPVTGWAAARDDVGLGAWILFGILFLWQLPHTLAIARLYRDDYARAGIQVLPVVDPDGGSTERNMITGSLGLLVVSLLPTLAGMAGRLYFSGALVLGVGLVVLSGLQALRPGAKAARRVLWGSLLYLPLLLVLLVVDKS